MCFLEVDREEIAVALRQHVIKITFEKQCGQLRDMRCTTRSDLLPASVSNQSTGRTGLAVPAWDLDLGQWRSFRTDRVIDWQLADE